MTFTTPRRHPPRPSLIPRRPTVRPKPKSTTTPTPTPSNPRRSLPPRTPPRPIHSNTLPWDPDSIIRTPAKENEAQWLRSLGFDLSLLKLSPPPTPPPSSPPSSPPVRLSREELRVLNACSPALKELSPCQPRLLWPHPHAASMDPEPVNDVAAAVVLSPKEKEVLYERCVATDGTCGVTREERWGVEFGDALVEGGKENVGSLGGRVVGKAAYREGDRMLKTAAAGGGRWVVQEGVGERAQAPRMASVAEGVACGVYRDGGALGARVEAPTKKAGRVTRDEIRERAQALKMEASRMSMGYGVYAGKEASPAPLRTPRRVNSRLGCEQLEEAKEALRAMALAGSRAERGVYHDEEALEEEEGLKTPTGASSRAVRDELDGRFDGYVTASVGRAVTPEIYQDMESPVGRAKTPTRGSSLVMGYGQEERQTESAYAGSEQDGLPDEDGRDVFTPQKKVVEDRDCKSAAKEVMTTPGRVKSGRKSRRKSARVSTRELKGLLEGIDGAVGVDGKREEVDGGGTGAGDEKGGSVMLSEMRTPRQVRSALGAETVVTPVRRSLRISRRLGAAAVVERNSKKLELADYAYMPNKNLGERGGARVKMPLR